MTGRLIFFSNLRNRRNTCNSNYDMSIKNCQAIQKSCLDRKSNAWFKLGSESGRFSLWHLEFLGSAAGHGFEITKWPAVRPIFFSNLRNRRNLSNWNYDMSNKNCQVIQKNRAVWMMIANLMLYARLWERKHGLWHKIFCVNCRSRSLNH